MKRFCLLLALLALILPTAAQAHASFTRSEPADGAVLAGAPSRVRLHFTDAVQPVEAEAIRNGGASVLAGDLVRDDARTLVVPLRAELGEGDYTVRWRAVSDDGHVIQGVLAFGIGEGRAPPLPALTVGGNGPGPTQILARWLFLAGVLLVFGVSVFQAAVARESSRGTSVLLAVGFAFATVGSFGLVPHADGDPTRAERVYEAGALIAMTGLTAAAIALVERWVRYVAWAAAVAMLPVPTLAGHALDRGQPRVLNVVADVVHLGAAGVWVGGVAAVGLALHAGDRRPMLRRLSAVALGSVVVLGITGVVRAFGELSAISQLWDTDYGRALSIKTLLLAALVAIGFLNRARLVPRNAVGALRVTTGAETALLAAVVVAVAFLTALPPGRAVAQARAQPQGPPPAPPAGALVLARAAGQDALAVALTASEVQVTVLGADNNGVEADPVLVNGVEATERCGPGCYSTPLPARHDRLEVSIRGDAPLTFPLSYTWPPRPGQELADRAYRAFRASGSVAFTERLASSADRTLTTRFRIEAPNRLAYDIEGGPAAISIGARRWDRLPGSAGWELTDTSPSTQPTAAWRQATNAKLLAPDRVAFYDPTIPAWFDVRVDPRTGLPRELRMTAAAHFMRHDYRAYGTAREIFPPQEG